MDLSEKRIGYPPCDGHSCLGKYLRSWPKLVGKPAAVAKAQIEKDDHPYVTAVVVRPYTVVEQIFCCNRVYLYVNDDAQRTVRKVPIIG